jgi:hypothetical protein
VVSGGVLMFFGGGVVRLNIPRDLSLSILCNFYL